MDVKEAGKIGGRKVANKYGPAFFAEIGRLGQKRMRAKYPNQAVNWGRMGGRPKKVKFRKRF